VPDDLAQTAARLSRLQRPYHRIDLGQGVILEGQTDPASFLDAYELPADMTGMTVIDVGTSTGFFALECAKRGAKVTAVDVLPGSPVVPLAQALGLEMRFEQLSIYDLGDIGVFDVVICGSLLMHLPDPVGAIRALRNVCGNRLILSASCYEGSETSPWPLFELVATKAFEGDYWAYWSFSAAGLSKLAQMVDMKVQRVTHFTMDVQHEGGQVSHVPHALIDAVI
jgi:2-polyprenyl-3-methyl-5-hydroxy-6-metoxy-1,4-benzoquinol methylase